VAGYAGKQKAGRRSAEAGRMCEDSSWSEMEGRSNHVTDSSNKASMIALRRWGVPTKIPKRQQSTQFRSLMMKDDLSCWKFVWNLNSVDDEKPRCFRPWRNERILGSYILEYLVTN
jgi:hypothetical protein